MQHLSIPKRKLTLHGIAGLSESVGMDAFPFSCIIVIDYVETRRLDRQLVTILNYYYYYYILEENRLQSLDELTRNASS